MSKVKKILLMCAAYLLVAAIAIGGTVAYLTSQDSDVNVMTMGNVKIEQIEQQYDENGNLEDFKQDKPLYPYVGTLGWKNTEYAGGAYRQFTMNNVVDKYVSVKNTGKSDAYVRTLIAFEMGDFTYDEFTQIGISVNLENGSEFSFEGAWNIANDFVDVINGYTYNVMEFVHAAPVKPGETTVPSLLQVYLNKDVTNEDVARLDGNGNEKYDIIVISQAVQTAGFENANDAFQRNVTTFAAAKNALDSSFGAPEERNEETGVSRCSEWFGNTVKAYEATLSDKWDGTADTAWYNDTDTTFTLETAEQFAGFGKLVDEGNTFEGKTIMLKRDLDLYLEDADGEKVSFNPIGYGYNIVFKGTFDGQGHTIKNLYQNGWALGLDYSTEGGGLFASVVDATIKNLTIDGSEIVMECIDMGTVAGYSYGNCTYENISITNSSISNYNRYTGGVVGEVNGIQTFKNVDVDSSCAIHTLWGSFDTSLGGIVGGKWGDATLTFEDCDVACQIDSYNDVTATPSRQWYAYRRAGMLIGNSEETTSDNGRATASASYLTAINCTVTYGDWVNYTYCEFNNMSTSWPHCRVQAGGSSAYTNARYGVANDLNGNKVVDDNHVHAEGEDHNLLLEFDQIFGGDVGVYGGKTHDGVTIIYNDR